MAAHVDVDTPKELLSVLEPPADSRGSRLVVRTGGHNDLALGVAACCRAMAADSHYDGDVRERARALLEALVGPDAIDKPLFQTGSD